MLWWLALGVVAAIGALLFFSWLSYGKTPRGMAASGKAAKLDALLTARPERANETDEASRELPMHAAAAHGHVAVIDVLVKHGASVNARCAGGGTPLMMAAHYDNVAAMAKLVAAGADVDDCDDMGMTALHSAVARGNAGVVKALLEAGAQPDLKDAAGRTALDAAGDFQQAELQRLLLGRGAKKGSQVKMRDLKPPKTAGGAHRVPMALMFSTEDRAFETARQQARASVPEMRMLFEAEAKVAVKGAVDAAQPNEKLWVAVETLDERSAEGHVVSTPIYSGAREGAREALLLDVIDDWVAQLPDGSLRGGFGLKVMIAHAREEYGALPESYAELAEKLTP